MEGIFCKIHPYWSEEYHKNVLLTLGNFLCSVVTSVTFSRNSCNYKKKIQETNKNQKVHKNPKKDQQVLKTKKFMKRQKKITEIILTQEINTKM